MSLCINYRYISLLFLAKLRKKMHIQEYNPTKTQNTHNPNFGFKSLYSTNYYLISFIWSIKSKFIFLEEFVCGIFLDLEKAFDAVDRKYCSLSLVTVGFEVIPMNCSSCKKFVFTIFILRKYIRVVPQGSTLRPLLF